MPAWKRILFKEIRSIYLIAGYSLILAVGKGWGAIEEFRSSSPAWMRWNRWYEDLLVAILGATTFVACAVYEYRRRVRVKDNIETNPDGWREKCELRVVLYVFAVIQLIGVPVAIFKALQAARDKPFPFKETFWDLFQFDSVVFAGIGIGVIVFDRWLIRREKMATGNYCSSCGYDLRATPDRCPECGMVPEKPIVRT